MKRFSICIPTWEQGGLGTAHLKALLASIEKQTYPRSHYEIIVSDHSKDQALQDWISRHQISCTYLRYEEKYASSSANVNHAIRHAQGEIIKIMFQDDLMFSPDCLSKIDQSFTEDVGWLVCGCNHTTDGIQFHQDIIPKWNEDIPIGKNTISSPSVLSFINQDVVYFDESLTMLMDVEYYYQLYLKYGLPKCLSDILITNRQHPQRISATYEGSIEQEAETVRSKHGIPAKRNEGLNRTELINGLIQRYGFTSYLEIGVNTPYQPGYNWTGVEANIKHGVDPNVETTYTMTSDEFFVHHVSRTYDLIFIDGLHLFEQVYKDILNALNHLNKGGIIVVHDCNPLQEITQRRERVTSAWHGDVWKAIVKLRIEEPDLDIVTVDTDEGCGVIRKGKQDLLNVPESEDPMNYAFLQKHRKEALNLISAEDFQRLYSLKQQRKRLSDRFQRILHKFCP